MSKLNTIWLDKHVTRTKLETYRDSFVFPIALYEAQS